MAFLGNALRARFNYFGELYKRYQETFCSWLVSIRRRDRRSLFARADIVDTGSCTGPGHSFRPYLVVPNDTAPSAPVPSCRPRQHNTVTGSQYPSRSRQQPSTFQNSVDSLLLGATHHLGRSTSFSLVSRIGQFVQFPIYVLVVAATPYVVRAVETNARTLSAEILQVVTTLIVLSAGMSAQLFAVAIERGMPWALGAQYSDTPFFGSVLSLSILPMYVYPFLFSILATTRRLILSQVIIGIGTLTSSVLDILVIRSGNAYAVAWVSISVQNILLIDFLVYYRQAMKLWPLPRSGFLCAGLTLVLTIFPVFFWTGSPNVEIAYRITQPFLPARWQPRSR